MANYNHTCKICGKGYNACDTCLNAKNYAPWRAIGCCEDHFKVFMVLYEYGSKTLTKDDARAMLAEIDISGWENYPDHNRLLIAAILAEEVKAEEENLLAAIPERFKADEISPKETSVQTVQTQPNARKQASKGNYSPYSKYGKK
ncbi:MAG: hypothetical protein PHX74_06535 [Candidatus Sumerlaeales bacterium]|nr:hypothetical protein [Candidatus Sumerlaeales bacterium]